MSGILTLMGSGETSPTMVKTHRATFERIGNRPAVMLDTPFGFQENADIIAEKAIAYFATSLGRQVDVASFRNAKAATELEVATLSTRVREAGWVFAAPGSPTYAVAQWRDTDLAERLVDKVTNQGGAVTFASAAAVTLGTHVLPVYEIYKVGADLHWIDGLDVMGAIGYPCAVIPHFDNAEGGNHDTRYCYMGATRLAALREQLPGDVPVVGVDEHTALVMDLASATLRVDGRGGVTVMLGDSVTTIPAGTTAPFDVLGGRPGDTSLGSSAGSTPSTGSEEPRSGTAVDPLEEAISSSEGDFETALAARDGAGAAAVILELEATLTEWSADTLQSDLQDRGRSLMRTMIVRLGESATVGLEDPRSRVGGFVDLVIAARQNARTNGDYAGADALRDGLIELGLEIRDTPDGTEWNLR
jgi:cyanophycinase-like exopeptidase